MDNEILLSVLTAITSALGVKEIWQLWKKRMELNEEKATKDARAKDKLMSEVILDLKHKIEELESKIDALIEENTMLREKLARMEERLMMSASKRGTKSRIKKETTEEK